jgi:hypothetical protein
VKSRQTKHYACDSEFFGTFFSDRQNIFRTDNFSASFGKSAYIYYMNLTTLTQIGFQIAHIANLRTTTLRKVFLFVNDDDVKKNLDNNN